MNFTRGKQIVFHNSTYTDWNGVPLIPPVSMNTKPVGPSDSIVNLFNDAGAFADKVGKLDAVHLISHGNKDFFQLGKEGMTVDTVGSLIPLAGKTRTVLIWACQVGRGIAPGTTANFNSLGTAIANVVQTRVIVGKENQGGSGYSYQGSVGGINKFQPERFMGEVYLCHANGNSTAVFKDSRTGQAQIDVEGYIFNGTN